MPELSGRTVIVTGAGAGVGRALSAAFVGKGAYVVGIGRSAPGLEQTRQLCSGTDAVEMHELSVTDAAGLERLFAQIVQQRGGFDLLVNNAAVYPRQQLHEMSAQAWTDGVATNLNGVAFGCRAALRALPANRSAVILNVGSFAYLGPEPASTLYCATKAAVGAFSRAWAVELAAANSKIIVNTWIPGSYRTTMSPGIGDDPALAFDRLIAVWDASLLGPGGRTFEGSTEVLPPRGIRTRLKSWLLLRRTNT